MGAINTPTKKEKHIPEQAKGNPVYEQTRQDMPLWCCGRNCGRNSRITVFVLGFVGICASAIVCLSPNYFRFVALRNDTFYDEEKIQPIPFEYATEANVGLFRYQILEVIEYPWPSNGQRELFDAMHNRELERLASLDADDEEIPRSKKLDIFDRLLQIKFPTEFFDDDDDVRQDDDDAIDDDVVSTGNSTMHHQNDTMDVLLTRAPADSPIDIDEIPPEEIPDVIPGSNAKDEDRIPTSTPTSAPTGGNPNDLIDVEIGVVQPYPAGNQLDKLFRQGQQGAMWAPILAMIGLIFASIEFFCCIYKCSWLPTAIFLYVAFMMQLMTMFLFMSEDFCDYAQDCWLGSAGYMSVIAVICYFICQILVCMTPRPPPKYNLLKKPPVRRKKRKKKKRGEFDEDEKDSLSGTPDRFADESSMSSDRYLDTYDDQDPYGSHYGDSNSNSYSDDPYNSQYGDTNSYSGDQDPYSSQYGSSKNNSDGYDNDPKNEYGSGSDYNDSYDQDGYNNGYDGYDGNYNNADQGSSRDIDQGSHISSNGQTYGDYNEDYNEDYIEAPSSSSSRRRKK